MRATKFTLAAAAFVLFATLGAASAGERRAAPPFVCAEANVPRRTIFWDIDDDGNPLRIASYDQVGRFTGTLRLPMDDLGPTYRSLNPAARFNFSIGNVQYLGRLSDSTYVEGRPTAVFTVKPGYEDPDTGEIGPPLVKARVTWTRTRVIVVVSGKQSVLFPDPYPQNVSVDDTRPMSVAFYGVEAEFDVHVTGFVKTRTVRDGFGVDVPLTTVKLRGRGLVRTQ
jgi:hypothetical protein